MRCYLVALIFCVTFCSSAAPEPDNSQFRPLLTAFLDSWNRHDAHAFAANFASDAVVTTVGGTRVEGREPLEKYMQPSFSGTAFKDSTYSANIRIARLLRSDLAVLDLDWEMAGARGRDGNPRAARNGTLSWVVVKHAGRWEIASYHNSEVSQTRTSTPPAPKGTADERLAAYRKEIDGVDQQIAALLNERAATVQRIGNLKKEAGLPIAAPAREQQVIARVVEAGKSGPLPPATLKRIYEAILLEMRKWEAGGGTAK